MGLQPVFQGEAYLLKVSIQTNRNQSYLQSQETGAEEGGVSRLEPRSSSPPGGRKIFVVCYRNI